MVKYFKLIKMQDLIFYNKYDNEIIYLNLKIIRCHTTECRATNV